MPLEPACGGGGPEHQLRPAPPRDEAPPAPDLDGARNPALEAREGVHPIFGEEVALAPAYAPGFRFQVDIPFIEAGIGLVVAIIGHDAELAAGGAMQAGTYARILAALVQIDPAGA